MLEVKGSANITIEGVGEGAEFFQFGIGFEECNSIEIKNLTFTDYPEDALNFMGGDRADLANFSRYWIHNCTFNQGKNNWDISGERDKYNGDGSIDFNNVSNATLAYNLFNQTHKTMLFGSGDSEACMNMTMHHNYFYKVGSRLPLGRNVNIHSYNNFFDQCKNCSDVRKNSYIFSENNYYKSTSKPFNLSSSYVKSFGDIFSSSSASGITKVTDRTKTISGSCKPDKVTNLANFDTNSQLFYYDSEAGSTRVSIMTAAADVPEFVKKHAGAGKCESLAIQ
jgi:pectate lyase